MILTFALAIAAGVGGAFAYSRVAGTAHAVPRNVAHHPHAKPRGGSQRARGGVPKKTT